MEQVGVPIPWGIVPMERVWVPFTVPNPAAGADWAQAVPGGKLWVLQGFRATLTAAAVAVNRRVRFRITDGEQSVGEMAQLSADITTGVVATVGGLLGAVPGRIAAATLATSGLPLVYLQPGWTFGVLTENLQGADQWSAIRGWVAQYELRGLERAATRYARAVLEAGGVG